MRNAERSNDLSQMRDKGLHNHVLLHHVEGHIGGEMGRRPHQCRPEHDGQIGDGHPVDLLVLRDLFEVLEQGH